MSRSTLNKGALRKMIKQAILSITGVTCLVLALGAQADPFPPYWENGNGAAVHFPPVAWPDEPANPLSCDDECGEWKPYTRFQQSINDPRTRDPSNGGTRPQSYVNISSSCTDESQPSIYYYLHQGATPSEDVVMFRWRVEASAHNYATGPNAGNFSAGNPWASALWTVLFDIDGSGVTDFAAHIDGSSGSPSQPIDRLSGIWSNVPSHSIDHANDPNIHLLGHNSTAFIGPGNRILNFNNSLNPTEDWPNGSAETVWDYGTTRATLVSKSPCNEYFIDYQIPVGLLDASPLGGPKVERSTPIAMLFCTANSLNNPFQKDCAINNKWTATPGSPAPFGDYISFDQEESYPQPIITDIQAIAPLSCPGEYHLEASVQDVLALTDGSPQTSVQQVRFYYWYDQDGDGTANEPDGNWVRIANDGTLADGSFTRWTTSWDATSLPKGRYLIGVQAVDDNTLVDDGMTASGIDNRTFSYISGNASNKIHIAGSWESGQQSEFPAHSPSMSPSATEDWYGNPSVTGQQVAVVATAINACGIAPDITLSADPEDVVVGGTVALNVAVTNPAANLISVDVDNVSVSLPPGFSYQTDSALIGGSPLANPTVSGRELSWALAPAEDLEPGESLTISFNTTATTEAGQYNVTSSADTSFGILESDPAAIAVDGPRLNLSITPSAYTIAANGTSQLTYTLQYRNDSAVRLNDSELTLSLPNGVNPEQCSGGVNCHSTANSIVWDLGSIAGLSTGTVTGTVTVDSAWTAPTMTVNAQLNSSPATGGALTRNANASVAVTGFSVIGEPDFTLQKAANTNLVNPGESITYSISYENVGRADADDVIISTVIPAGSTFISGTGSPNLNNGVLEWSLGTVVEGASGVVNYTVQTANPFVAANPIVTQAEIDWLDGTTVTSNNAVVGVTGQACNTYYFQNTFTDVGADGSRRVATITPAPQPGDTGASVTVTAPNKSSGGWAEVLRFYQDPASPNAVPFTGNLETFMYYDRSPGQGLNLRARVFDYNSDTGYDEVTDLLGSTVTTAGGSTRGLLTSVVPLSGTLQPDHRLLWVFEVQTDHNSQTTQVQFQFAGTVANNVSGTTPATFANARAEFCVTPPANLSVSAQVDRAQILEGEQEQLTYSVNFLNSGVADASNVVLTTTIPMGATACEVSTDGTSWSACDNASNHQFNQALLAGGTSEQVYVRALAPAGSTGGDTLTFTADLDSDQTVAVTATALTKVQSGTPTVPDFVELTSSLSTNKSYLVPGEQVTYDFAVTNLGTISANNLTFEVTVPNESFHQVTSCGGCSVTGNVLSWDLTSLASGSTHTVSINADITSDGLSAGTTEIFAEASVTSDEASSTAGPVSLSISGNPALSAELTSNAGGSVSPGDLITFTFNVENFGNTSAESVVATLPIPQYLSYSSGLVSNLGQAQLDTVNNRIRVTVPSLAPEQVLTVQYVMQVGNVPSGTTLITQHGNASAANSGQVASQVTLTAEASAVLALNMQVMGETAYPSATVTAAAVSDRILVDSTRFIQIGQYVRIAGQVREVVSLSNTSLTLNQAITVSSGDVVVAALIADLTYQNTGDATATSVELSFTVPADLDRYNPSTGSILGSGTSTWSIGQLQPQQSGGRQAIFFPTGTLGSFVVSSQIEASNATTQDEDRTLSIGGLQVRKSTSTPTINAGDSASYRIEIENNLPSSVSGISVTDTLSTGFSYIAASATVDGIAVEPTGDPSIPTWTNLSVAGNDVLVIEFEAVTDPDIGGAVYQNEVDVSSVSVVGIANFDALATNEEDVTVLALTEGVLSGHIFYSDDGTGAFNSETDLALAGVQVLIYEVGADCSDIYNSGCWLAETNEEGEYSLTLEGQEYKVEAQLGTGTLDADWVLTFGANDNVVEVIAGTTTTDVKGFSEAPDVTTYTVTFQDYDGSVIDTQTVDEGNAATAPTDPTRTGYTFAGWDPSDFSEITADLTVTAQYTINTYTVTATASTGGLITPSTTTVNHGETTTFTVTPDTGFSINTVTGCDGTLDGNSFTTGAITAGCSVSASFNINSYTVTFQDHDGTELSTQSVEHGSAATAPADPSRTGYTFTGWNPSDFTEITSALTVTAQYAINTYTVTFQDHDGTELSTQSVEHGSGATAPADPVRTGYTFTGWDTSFAEITNDLTVTAQYTINSYTVAFQDHDGTVLDTQSVEHGSGATAPADPTRTGYTFTGWDTSFAEITNDLTVTAQYTINSYTVTFQDHDGTVLDTQSVEHGSGATAPADPVRTDYTFTGWDPSDFSEITGALTVTAQYAINTYTVTFQDHDGTVLDTQSIEHGSGATAPTDPSRTGYTFTGWDPSDFSEITGALTVTAQYAINTYTVTFQDHDGTVLDTQSIEHGSGATAPVDPSRTGYTFTGWSVSFDEITEALTVTAEYAINTYTVTFADYDGSVIETQTIEHGSGATAPADPSRTGYTFTGWDPSDFSEITGALTVTAQYAINTYTVTFQDHDGTELSTQSVEHGSAATAPADPSRTGYTFTGWDPSDFSEITGALTVTAQYAINTYTVTFQDHDGTELSTQSVEHGSGATAPTDPTRTGYTFTGWDTSFTEITNDLTVTAEYTINSYTVTFQDHDGTVLDTQSIEHGNAATAPTDPSRTGYTFTGWDPSDFSDITGALTVTAQYTINSYTVTFQDHDGTELSTQSVEHGSGATAPTDPVRTGYTFTGWDASFAEITEALTVTAEYAINTYTVTFQDHDGTELSTQSVEHGSAASAPTDPTRTGYTFTGWDPSDFSEITGALTVTAQYAINTYTVTFQDHDGTVLDTQSVEHGSGATAPADPVRTGYTFTGWDPSDFSEITGALTVTAQYAINTYTVTFQDHDGTVLDTQSVEHGSGATAPTDPVRTGYTFTGWDASFAEITNDLTVTAQYTINTYTVTFQDHDGTVLDTQSIEHGSGATAPADPSRTGYTFTGWDPSDFSEITGALTVTAQYAINTYTVTFQDHDGTVLDTQSVEHGSAATAPADPTRTGYTFTGWDPSDFTEITGALTVTAEYTINSYTVTFQDHDGTVLDTQSIEHGSGATAPVDPVRTGYTFTGWDPSDFTDITDELTVIAQYAINTYTVTFQDHDGTELSTQSVEHGSGATAPADPVRTGYTFTGWDTSFAEITNDLTVTAQYTINSYTVTFQDHDGTELSTQSVEHGSGATAPADPTRTGYTFTGWDPSDFSEITGALTVTAQYAITTYTVTFQDHDGTELSTQSVEHGSGATAPADPSRTGYTFTGWSVSFDEITEALTVTAEYAINTYTVTFQDHDGTVLDTQSVEHGSGATAPAAPSRTGYTFTGWDPSDFSEITGALTVTAQYTINSYTVTFQDHDGTVLDTQSVEHGSGATAPTDPVRTGYTFTGWDASFAEITNDLTVTAQYTINSYTVTFQNHDGTELSTQSVEHGSAATAPADPTRTGYTFTGWDPSDFSEITGALTVTAQYAINTYTVTFQDHDGTVLDTQSIEHGSAATAPTDPSRTGYTFTGWDPSDFTEITGALTVTAQYAINTYTVTFQDHDGTVLDTQSIEHGSAATAPTDPSRTGYTFTGWDPSDFSEITGDLTITAQYAINTYTVTFQDHDGSVLDTQTVEHGSGATAPADPVRTGYTFTGWDPSFAEVTGDLTVTAQYAINTYTVTFQDHDGTVLDTQSVEHGSGATAPADPSRTGYTFTGWDPSDFSEITGALTVTAQYAINTYTVTFQDHDGTELSTQSVEHGSGATAPVDPVRTGYTFTGWDPSDFSDITGALTVTAQYAINTYTVTFQDHDGTELSTQSVEHGSAATAPADPSRTGYTFTGWDPSDFSEITGALTVTAQYAINTYTVTFQDHDGTVLDTQSIEHGSGATAPADPTRTGYTFTGWDPSDFSDITGALTVTAQYAINTYTVTFQDHDGTVLDTQSVEHGSGAAAPADPVRTGYTFTGWDPSDFSEITGALTVTAQYAINTYSVTFQDHDGTVLDTQSVEHGSGATAPADPTRTGYTFTGWDTSFAEITNDLTVTAEYTINSYTVTFQDHDGTVLDTQSVEHGSAATAPADPTRTGYTFTGWDPSDFSEITGALTVTAEYAINTYTVTFADYDGSVIETQTIEHGSGATAPADPTRTGYTFTGWDPSDFSEITGALTVTAQYAINTYTVTFQDHDSTVLDTQSVEHGSGAIAPADPSRTGYTFTGWSVSFDEITEALTVTAEYAINTYTVTFADYDGSVIETQTIEHGSGATAPADPTREGYTFTGWDASFAEVTGD
uniref:InlB B-repeat-containing protein n=1 Tax=Aliidiomarina indica TaxID=2749147 RepID=UPI00188DD096